LNTNINFKQLARQTPERRLKMRYLAIHHFLAGKHRTQIAEAIGVAKGSVNTWITKFLHHGIDGLQLKRITGRPAKLTSAQEKEMSLLVLRHVETNNGGRLIGADIKQFIEERFNLVYE